jgi:hypothetical protein
MTKENVHLPWAKPREGSNSLGLIQGKSPPLLALTKGRTLWVQLRRKAQLLFVS